MEGLTKSAPSWYTYLVRKKEKGKKMKRHEIKKDARDFGYKCDWYNKENMEAVEAANPTKVVGGKTWPAAYFVEEVETVRDEMFGVETYRTVVAGPFATETAAQEWADMH